MVTLAEKELELKSRFKKLAGPMDLRGKDDKGNPKSGFLRVPVRYHGIKEINGVDKEVVIDLGVYDFGEENESVVELETNKEPIDNNSFREKFLIWFRTNKPNEIVTYKELAIQSEGVDIKYLTYEVKVLGPQGIETKRLHIWENENPEEPFNFEYEV